jgi:hypothetical protein
MAAKAGEVSSDQLGEYFYWSNENGFHNQPLSGTKKKTLVENKE